MGLAAFQQFVGINIIFYYGEILWKAAGATEQWALRINLLTGLVNILATIPAIMLVDRIGRKPLLLVGSVGMALTLGAMAVVFGTASVGPDGKPLLSHMAAVAGLTAANLYIVAFAMSWVRCWARTPMHLLEDFAFGRKPADAKDTMNLDRALATMKRMQG